MAKAGTLLSTLLTFVLGCAGAQVPPVAHTTLISDSLVASLDAIADTATIEHFRCLGGVARRDSLFIVAAWEPVIVFADYNGVKAGACPPHTVGTWHTHLPYNIPMNDPHNRATPVEPWSVCDLSPVDKASAATEAWTFSMISVANGVHCAWQRVTEGDSLRFVRLPWALQ